MIIPAIASPGTVFFLRQYVLSVMPPSLIEAARIDGASELYTFHRIAIPIMSPGIATMSIMGFIGGWNAYLLPMIILNKNKKFTLPVMMATLRASTDITANQGAIYLAVAISVIPILLVFAFLSKYMKTGNLIRRGLRETKENGMIKILGNRNKGEVLWLHTESEK